MSAKKQNIMRTVCLAAGVLLIVCGIYGEEPSAVWQKAVRICLECIGIG